MTGGLQGTSDFRPQRDLARLPIASHIWGLGLDGRDRVSRIQTGCMQLECSRVT